MTWAKVSLKLTSQKSKIRRAKSCGILAGAEERSTGVEAGEGGRDMASAITDVN